MIPTHHFKITAPAHAQGAVVEMDGEDISMEISAITIEMSVSNYTQVTLTYPAAVVEFGGIGVVTEEAGVLEVVVEEL